MSHRLSDTLYAVAAGEGVLLYTPVSDNTGFPDPYASKMALSAEEVRELHAYLNREESSETADPRAT